MATADPAPTPSPQPGGSPRALHRREGARGAVTARISGGTARPVHLGVRRVASARPTPSAAACPRRTAEDIQRNVEVQLSWLAPYFNRDTVFLEIELGLPPVPGHGGTGQGGDRRRRLERNHLPCRATAELPTGHLGWHQYPGAPQAASASPSAISSWSTCIRTTRSISFTKSSRRSPGRDLSLLHPEQHDRSA